MENEKAEVSSSFFAVYFQWQVASTFSSVGGVSFFHFPKLSCNNVQPFHLNSFYEFFFPKESFAAEFKDYVIVGFRRKK